MATTIPSIPALFVSIILRVFKITFLSNTANHLPYGLRCPNIYPHGHLPTRRWLPPPGLCPADMFL